MPIGTPMQTEVSKKTLSLANLKTGIWHLKYVKMIRLGMQLKAWQLAIGL